MLSRVNSPPSPYSRPHAQSPHLGFCSQNDCSGSGGTTGLNQQQATGSKQASKKYWLTFNHEFFSFDFLRKRRDGTFCPAQILLVIRQKESMGLQAGSWAPADEPLYKDVLTSWDPESYREDPMCNLTLCW